MTRSDIGTIGIIYATCLIFLYMTLQLKAAAQIYPLCLIGGLAVLNTLYLGKRLFEEFRARCHRRILNDLPEIFAGFQPGQFFFVSGACVFYLVLWRYVGFYLAGLVYMLAVMWFLKVKPLQICATIVFLGILVYAVFSMFLKVPLPTGTFFS